MVFGGSLGEKRMKKTVTILKFMFGAIMALLAGVLYVSSLLSLSSSPWAPSRKKDLKRIRKILDPKPGEVIIDLGSGDGRVCVELAKYSRSKIIGVELSLMYFIISKIRALCAGVGEKVELLWNSFYRVNVSSADTIFIYLTKRASRDLSRKLACEIKSGAKVFTYRYPLSGWQYVKKYQSRPADTPLYLYVLEKGYQEIVFS